jgi:hypothetical protein
MPSCCEIRDRLPRSVSAEMYTRRASGMPGYCIGRSWRESAHAPGYMRPILISQIQARTVGGARRGIARRRADREPPQSRFRSPVPVSLARPLVAAAAATFRPLRTPLLNSQSQLRVQRRGACRCESIVTGGEPAFLNAIQENRELPSPKEWGIVIDH